MSVVVIAEDDLIHARPTAIRRFLQPLAMKPAVACDSPRTAIAGGRVLAAHDGQVAGKEYRDWKFSSKHRDILCQYFELWRPAGSHRKWALDRAYLTLFLTDRTSRQSRELICVHSDPNDLTGGTSQMYKRGPHLHIKHLAEPLPHAHFPLTIGYVDEVINSEPSLTRVLQEITSMLSIEVIDRFEEASK